MSTLYQRRVEQEWRLLEALAECNAEVLKDCTREREVDSAVFHFILDKTPALVETASQLRIREEHDVALHFPRFFPSVPIEARLLRPVFHPNVHPETGFVCLWNRFSPGDTVIEAVALLRRVVTWELWNEEADNLIQPAAVVWYREKNHSFTLPLSRPVLERPAGFDLARTYARRPEGSNRRRLS
jgi:hypothetical protein